MPQKLPITFLITDLHLGGTPRLLRDLALGLQNSTPYQPTIISLKPFPKGAAQNVAQPPSAVIDEAAPTAASSIPPLTIPEQLIQQNIQTISLNISSPLHFPSAIPHLAKLLNHSKPGILYSLLLHANLLATLTLPFLSQKPKLIHSIHTLQPDPAWHWTLTGLLAPFADAVIAPSQPILEKIAHHGPYQRGQVIPNGIDIQRFATAHPFPQQDLPWPPSAPVVGYIGRYDPVKNLPLLLRAFAQLLTAHALQNPPATSAHFSKKTPNFDFFSPILPYFPNNRPPFPTISSEMNLYFPLSNRPPHLALIGYGPQESHLRRLATSLHIAPHVHFMAPTTVPERWYKSFTCHCLPSCVEGFGLTLVEAIAAGIPVVAIDTAVTRSILRQGIDGMLVPRPEANLLAKCLHEVIAKSQSAPQLPPNAPTWPPNPSPATLSYLQKHFTTAKMVELHAEFFKIFLP